jgi:hypothetical protein
MPTPILATCGHCGTEVEVQPPNLPSTGGSLLARDDPVRGWLVEEYVCGRCWERRPRTWPCTHCGGTGPIWSNFCTKCHAVRPDPLPYVPDWDLIAKEERERKRQHEALVAEWDREYPGWRFAAARTQKRF